MGKTLSYSLDDFKGFFCLNDWKKIKELEEKLKEAKTFKEMVDAINRRNFYRRKLWNLFLYLKANHQKSPWERLARILEVDINIIKIEIIDYLIEITFGDSYEICRLSKMIRISLLTNFLNKFYLIDKLNFMRATGDVMNKSYLRLNERHVLLRKLFTHYYFDNSLPRFCLWGVVQINKTSRSRYVYFIKIKNEHIELQRGLKELNVGEKLIIMTDFDDRYGTIFKIFRKRELKPCLVCCRDSNGRMVLIDNYREDNVTEIMDGYYFRELDLCSGQSVIYEGVDYGVGVLIDIEEKAGVNRVVIEFYDGVKKFLLDQAKEKIWPVALNPSFDVKSAIKKKKVEKKHRLSDEERMLRELREIKVLESREIIFEEDED